MYMEPDGDCTGRQTQRPTPAKPLQEGPIPEPELVYEKEPDKYAHIVPAKAASAVTRDYESPGELNAVDKNSQNTPSLTSRLSPERLLNDWETPSSIPGDGHATMYNLNKGIGMELNKDIQKRAFAKLAAMAKQAEDLPGQYDNNDLANAPVRTDVNARLPELMQAIMDPGVKGNAILGSAGMDAMAHATGNGDIFNTMKGIGAADNPLIRALGSIYSNSGR